MRAPRQLPQSQVSLTTVFTVCFGVLAVCALVLFVTHTLVALTITAGALMIAVALDHLVALLVERRVKRGLAIVIVTVASLGLLVGAILLLIPPVVSQTKLLVARWPQLKAGILNTELYKTARAKLANDSHLEELLQRLPDVVSDTAGTVLTVLGGVLNAIAAAVSIFFLAIFMLIFGGQVVDALLGEATPERRERYRKVVLKIYDLIGGYLGGLFLICSINATCASVMLAIAGIPFFLPLGLASGFSSLVPYAGPAVMAVVVTLLAMITAGFWKGVACAIYFVIYGQIEGNILGPLIFRRTVHVNPLIVLLSIIFFSEIAGIIGAILAVPLTAAIQIVLREVLRIRRERLDLARTALNSPGDTLSGIQKT
ncbi:MAG TPA: AI-2E family transporter [Polyangia bacterium]|nr:AI-2E family transporter [Polyangia bacterium]